MPAHVLRTIYHPCHPKAASCLSQASFAFHQPRALFPPFHSQVFVPQLQFFLKRIFQRRSLAKISMLRRKMIWIPDTSLHTDCGQNKWQRLCIGFALSPGEVGRVVGTTPLPDIPMCISSIFILDSKHKDSISFLIMKTIFTVTNEMHLIQFHPSFCMWPTVLILSPIAHRRTFFLPTEAF